MIRGPSGEERKDDGSDARCGPGQSRDGAHKTSRKEVTRQRLHVIHPELKTEEDDSDQGQRGYGRPNAGDEKARGRQESADEDRRGSRLVDPPASVNEMAGNPSAQDAPASAAA